MKQNTSSKWSQEEPYQVAFEHVPVTRGDQETEEEEDQSFEGRASHCEVIGWSLGAGDSLDQSWASWGSLGSRRKPMMLEKKGEENESIRTSLGHP